MPYLLLPREDGGVGYAWVDENYEPAAGEIVLEREPEDDEVIDAGSLRPKTEAEKLEEAKEHKIGELARDAIGDLSGLFTPGAGRDETALLVAGHVLSICEALNIQPDPRLTEVVQTGEKALVKKAEVEEAGSVEEVEAVAWTP